MIEAEAHMDVAMKDNLTGQVAFVTGAANGIGREIAIRFAAEGASVLAIDLDRIGLDETERLARSKGLLLTGYKCDVSDLAQVLGAFAKADEIFGPCSILVTAAGIALYTDFISMNEVDLDRVLSVNLKGVLLCAQEALKRMVANGSGNLVFISSVQATHSLERCVAYAATKAGVIAAARTLALETGKYGIRVNTISPGTIDTPMLTRDLEGMNVTEVEGFLDRVREANVLGRIGTSSEIAEAALFLVSSRSSYVTATDLRVDAGFSALKTF